MRAATFDAKAAAERLRQCSRIAVLGSGGAGKSTASRVLAQTLGLPLWHLDALYWLPGWQARPNAEWASMQRELVQADRWIVDGDYQRTLAIRLERADGVLFLDLPRLICLRRAAWRAIRLYGRVRPDIGEGCPEHLDLEFFAWIWSFPRRTRGRLLAARDAAPREQIWVVPRSPREVRQLLSELQALADRQPSGRKT